MSRICSQVYERCSPRSVRSIGGRRFAVRNHGRRSARAEHGVAERRAGDRESTRSRRHGAARAVCAAARRIGRADPPGRLLPGESQAAAKPAEIRRRRVRRLAGRYVSHRFGHAARAAARRSTASARKRPTQFCSTPAACRRSWSTRTPTAFWPATAGSATTPATKKSRSYSNPACPPTRALYNEYHALLVRVGKDYCRRRMPEVRSVPVGCMLPAVGSRDPMLIALACDRPSTLCHERLAMVYSGDIVTGAQCRDNPAANRIRH